MSPPEPVRRAPARSKSRSLTLTLLILVGIVVASAVSSGWLDRIPVNIGVGIVASLWVGIALALGLMSINAFGRRAEKISTATKLTGGAVIVAAGMGATAAAFDPTVFSAVMLGIPLTLVIMGCGVYTARRAQPSAYGIPSVGYGIAALLAAPLTGVWIWYMFVGPGYYAEFNRLEAKLKEIPGVEILDMGGNRDLTYEDIWARLRVKGKGDITLMALTSASLSDSTDVHISKIGPFSFRNERWGYGAVIDRDGKQVWHQSIGFTLNVGRRGEFGPRGRLAGRLEGEIRNVRQVVERYDDIIAIIRSLQQERLFFQNDDGSTIEYVFRSGS